jgi:hypothetical protein
MNNAAEVLVQKRLLMGIAPVDAISQQDLRFPVRVDLETISPHLSALNDGEYSHRQYAMTSAPKGFSRHPSGRYSLHYFPTASDQAQIRIYDLHRRYVPRRLLMPLVTIEEILLAEQNQVQNYLNQRIAHPLLYPGAAYPIHTRATGLRGRILQNDIPVRWAFIEARSGTDFNLVVARAKGDDRGEFLLQIPPSAVPDISLSESFTFDLLIWARPQPLVPVPVDVASIDPYWDAPIEIVTGQLPNDSVSSGVAIPGDYVQSQTLESVNFELSKMLNSHEVDDIVFNPP